MSSSEEETPDYKVLFDAAHLERREWVTSIDSPVPSNDPSPVISPSTQRHNKMVTQKEKAPAEFNSRRIAKGRFN